MLGDVASATVLDLYAGSGALGIEALSRGALRAVFVEANRKAASVIEANVRTLGIGDRAIVLALPVERLVARLETVGPFDLALVDPPYADVTSGLAVKNLEALLVREVFDTTARIVLEHARRDPAPVITGAALDRTRRYGDTCVTIYARAGDEASTSARSTENGTPPTSAQ